MGMILSYHHVKFELHICKLDRIIEAVADILNQANSKSQAAVDVYLITTFTVLLQYGG